MIMKDYIKLESNLCFRGKILMDASQLLGQMRGHTGLQPAETSTLSLSYKVIYNTYSIVSFVNGLNFIATQP